MQKRELIAGPYELLNKKNKQQKLIVSIFDGNVVELKKYDGKRHLTTQSTQCMDFEGAMTEVEDIIKDFKDEYKVVGEDPSQQQLEKDGPLLGKRKAPENDKGNVGPETDQKKKGRKKVVEEEKKEEFQENGEPARRSGRNTGKLTEYNIDKIIDEALDEVHNAYQNEGKMSVMLAQTYSPELCPDPKGWLISEKLDGVRCYWNGQAMYTRNGNPFVPPDWFRKALPKDMCLDGELWSGRADF